MAPRVRPAPPARGTDKAGPGIRRSLLAWIAGASLSLAATAHALSPDRAFSQLRHDRWTPDEGAPAQVMAITQTPDGFLWLGSRQGLYRFDGLRFERITEVAGAPIIDDDVISVMAQGDGAVWVGYFSGGMSRIGGVRPANYDYQREDVPAGSVVGFATDAAGRVWAATPATVVWLDPAADTWKTAHDMGFEASWSPKRIFVDREGGLWISYYKGEAFGIAHLAAGAARFESIPRPVQSPFLAQAADGTIWAADYWGVRPLAQAMPDPRHRNATVSWLAPEVKAGGVLFDQDGALWLSTAGGIARVRDPHALRAPRAGVAAPQPEVFGTAQGLTSEVVWMLFEDREGSIWAGTGNGLDRFRDNALAPVRLPRREQAFSMEVDQGGRIWVGNADRGPMRITPDASQPEGAAVEEMGDLGLEGVRALHRDAAGVLWIGGSAGGLWRSGGNGLERVALPTEFEGTGRVITIASDRAGGLWLSTLNAGLLRLQQGRWELQNARYGVHAGTTVRTLVEDAQGRIWSDAGQTIRVFENGRRRDLIKDGPGIGRISILRMHGEALWAGGVQGVSVRIGERFQRLLGRGGETFERTSGIVILADGEAWFGGRGGISRVPAAELARWREQPSYQVEFERFGVLDGLRGVVENGGGTLSALADDQGRVWFATNRGVHWIDPKRIARNRARAPVAPSLLALHMDEQPLALASSVQLPVGGRDLRIDYTAPSLRIPERVRFRYRLDGLDTRWQDAGDRRQALYSRLAPGNYRFRLIASDDAGRWSPQEASLAITVPLAFWQTRWFALACVLLAAALVWSLVRWRVTVARGQVQRVYRARTAERERIARELHDNLLQSVQALVMWVETAQGRLRRGESEAAGAGLSRALEVAGSGLAEGRDRIRALRGAEAQAEAMDLEAMLRDLPQQLALPPDIAYTVNASGRPRRLRNPQCSEVYWIAREAVSNAQRHADAMRIDVRLAYGLLSTTLTIEDDGCGINADVLARGGSDGHWGLAGMRERAALCGARLAVETVAGGGTCVRLRLVRWRKARGQ